MRFARLVVEADGADALSIALHPRLTVITGVAASEQADLSRQLADSLLVGGDGVHVELAEDRGRSLSIFRPPGRAARVVDTGSGTDVTSEFLADGRIDLARRYELPAGDLDPIDLESLRQVDVDRDPEVLRLAALDQAPLWSAASRVRVAKAELDEIVSRAGQDDMDPDLIAAVEENHRSLEVASAQLQRVRYIAAAVGLLAVLATLPAWATRPAYGFACALIGLAAMVTGLIYRRRVESRTRAAAEALSAAGTNSYIGFLVERVDGLFDGTRKRRRSEDLLAELDDANDAWRRLAGTVPVDWAEENRRRITDAAERLAVLASLGLDGAHASTGADGADERGAERLEADARLAEIAELLAIRLTSGSRGRSEHVPIVMSDLFAELDPERVPALLDVVDRSVGPPQLIIVTDGGAVAGWAEDRSAAGDLAVIDVGDPGSMSEMAG